MLLLANKLMHTQEINTEILIGMDDSRIVSDTILLEKETYSAFIKMKDAAEKDGIIIKLISGFRDFYRQQMIWNNKYKKFTNEFSLDGAYALKLSQRFSTGVALRYVYSNLTGGQQVGTLATKAAHTVAGDISGFYTKEIGFAGQKMNWAMGFNISNIGAKVSYTETVDKDFIPTNLRIGSSLATDIDEYNQLAFEFNINKLLVPTPPIYSEDGEIISGKDPDVSVISGIFQSFSDAPLNDREIRELIYSTGLEYWYDQQFAVRSGFFYEHPSKGDRQFFTLGAGVRYNVFGLDFSYLIPLQGRDEVNAVNPLSNTSIE